MSGLHFDITGDNSNLMRKLEETRNGIANTSRNIEESGMSIERMFGRMTKAAAAFGVGFSAQQFASQVMRIRGEFQQLEVAFNTMLGSKGQSDALMSQLVKTAAVTPFDLKGVANGAKQLLAYGTSAEDVNETLVRLGDIAAGLSIPLNDIVYLYGTTMTQGRLFTMDLRQFQGRGIPLADELAKQFGVAKDKVGELVTAGKVGFPEVQKAIEAMTNNGGKFGGLMEAQSKTITGQISNIEDSIDTAYNNIGKSSEGFINEALSGVSYLVENYEDVEKAIVELASTYGAYKAILITITALQKVNSAVVAQAVVEKRLAAAAGIALSNAEAIAIAKTKLFTIAQQGLIKSLKAAGVALAANPAIVAAAAIAGMSFAIYKVITAENEFGKANKRFNDSIKEAGKGTLSEQRELAELKGELSATTKGTDEYNKIRDKIVSNYGKYDNNLKNEIDQVGLLDTTYQNLTNSIQQSFDTRQYEKFKQEQGAALDDVMTKNLGKIQDRLYDDLGDEEGARIYTKIRNALLERKELDDDIKSTLDKVQDKGAIFADSRIDSYIRNIKEAQQVTDTFDKKARDKFGIKKGNSDYNNSGNKTKTIIPPSVTEEITAATKKVAELNQQIKDLRNGKLNADEGKTIEDTINAKISDLNVAEKALKTLTGIVKDTPNKIPENQKKLLDQQKSINGQLLELRRQNQQSDIDLMAEGSEKRIALIEFDYDNEIATILAKEKEWKDAQGGELTEGQTKEIHLALINAFVKMDKSTSLVDSEQLSEEKRAMDEYLAAYGDYQEKRKAITEKYNDLIANDTTKGGKLSLEKKLDEELKSLDLSEFKNGINFAEVFGNLDNLTTDSITRLRDKLKDYINKAASGLKPEDLKDLSDALSGIEIKAAEKNPFGEIGNSLDDYERATERVDQAQDKLNYVLSGGEIVVGLYEDETGKLCKKLLTQEQAENDLVKVQDERAESIARLNTALSAGVEKAQGYLDVATAIAGALEDFGIEAPERLTGFIDGVGETLDGLASIDLTKPVSIITGVAGAIGGIGKAIGSLFNNDKRHEKKIERLQDQVDTLDKSYEKLGDTIEKAYSNDASKLINQQNELLEQQKALIQQQIREEEDKKKTDNDRVKEWREQIEDIDEAITDNKENAVDAIFGDDLKSAIDNFAQAYSDAWTSGEDRAKSAKDTVRNMMRQMVTESIKAAIQSSKSMEMIRDKLKEFYSDNVLSGWEQDYIYNMADGLQRELDRQFGWADGLMNDELKPEEEVPDNSLKGAYAKASQESIDLLAGQTGAMRVVMEDVKNQMQPIREQMKLIYDLQKDGWQNVKAIRDLTDKVERNTDQIADNTRQIRETMGEIGKDTRRSADVLDGGRIDVNIKGM